MPTISEYVSLDFDLSDYEDDIKYEYCNGNCLKNYSCKNLKCELEDYVRQMEMNIYNNSRKEIKSYEDIYNDLKRMIEEN